MDQDTIELINNPSLSTTWCFWVIHVLMTVFGHRQAFSYSLWNQAHDFLFAFKLVLIIFAEAFFIEVWLTCNSILVPGVQHNDPIFMYIAKWSPLLSLVNIHHHRDLYLFLLVIRTFTIDSLSNFQMCSTVLLITVTMLYIASPWFTYFITGSFYILTCFTHFVHPPRLCLWQLPISLSMSLVSFSEVFSPKEFLAFCPHEFRLSMLNSPWSTFSVITHFLVLLIMCCAVLSRLVVSDSLGPHRL